MVELLAEDLRKHLPDTILVRVLSDDFPAPMREFAVIDKAACPPAEFAIRFRAEGVSGVTESSLLAIVAARLDQFGSCREHNIAADLARRALELLHRARECPIGESPTAKDGE